MWPFGIIGEVTRYILAGARGELDGSDLIAPRRSQVYGKIHRRVNVTPKSRGIEPHPLTNIYIYMDI
jgi:hypothetical protein